MSQEERRRARCLFYCWMILAERRMERPLSDTEAGLFHRLDNLCAAPDALIRTLLEKGGVA